ncbi:hypothetical protein ACEWY4_011204 [Coilia grayii]|uniref:Transcription intermediary factor 1-alpha-like n=1 Tax=Coilia grayii TaxID=363190 RepID=A0ABD1K437_9TELE
MHESSETTESRDVVGMENEAEGVTVRKKTGKQVCALSYLETCAECKQNFHKREPMLLPCLHSLCKTCVPLPWRTLAIPDQPGASPADRGSKSLNVIRCPVCKQECMDVDVMENFFLRDSVELPSSTVEKPTQLCMSCEDNSVASGFCEECVEFLCVTCIDAHQRVKFTKDHHIRQQEQLSKIPGISTPKPVFCDVHKQEPLKLFCETCDRPTCRDCQLLKHKDHNYQFLEDAYRNHRQNMEQMIFQLQEKRKSVEDVSDLINNGLAQADENYTAVHNEIKSSMCSLISEINRKGTMLLNQLEALTKDHRSSLRKQQQDVSSLSRHLDHVITFTKWATGHGGGTALLHCKRLILFQIRNLLRTKCSTAFVPQNIVHFQCQSAYWASSVELGSLMVERVPSPQLNSFQGLYPVNHPGQGYPAGFLQGSSQQPQVPHSTLAQLHMQVERLAQQQPPPPPPPPPPLAPPPHWPWCQSVPLPRPPPIRLPQRAPEPQGFHPLPPPQGRGFMPPPHHRQGLMMGPSCPPRHMDVVQTRNMLLYSHSAPLPGSDRLSSPFSPHLQRNDLAFTSPIPRPTFTQATFNSGSVGPGSQNLCRSPRAHPDTETKMLVGTQEFCSPPKRRRHPSPGPVIIIKDEPDERDDINYCTVRPSLPDSTEDQGRQGQAPQDGVAKDGAHHSTGVQTVVSQHKTQDWAQEVYHRTKAETLPQQGTTSQTSGLFQTVSLQQAAEGLSPTQAGGAVEQTQATQCISGHPLSPDGCSDRTREPKDCTRVVPKGQNGSSSDPQTSQASSGRQETLEEREERRGEASGEQCRVCHAGGELLCCDKCSNVYHNSCHIPPLLKPPCGQWFCTLCRDLYKPEMEYDSEIPTRSAVKNETSPMMKAVDKRKCEQLLLQMYCSELSAHVHKSVPSIFGHEQCDLTETPVRLAAVKRKLESHTCSYNSPLEFVSDVRSVLRNCFNISEVGFGFPDR